MKLSIGTDSHGKPFYLPLELVTTSLAILAKKRVGKSYAAAVFAEELMDAGQPVCIIDITGAHWGLKSSADGKSAGYPIVIFGGRHADVPLEENAGVIAARAIVEQRFSAILDFSIMSKAGMERFLVAFLGEFYRINQDAIHLICDEADRYAPQQPHGEEMALVKVMDDIVSRGGIKGIGASIISQRSAKVNKNVVTQCELLVAMRIVHPLDAKTIMEWVEMHATKAEAAEMLASLPTLPVGTAWFWWPGEGKNSIFECVKIRERKTFDSGATPKAGETRKQPKTLAQIDVAKLGADIAATVERAKANDPKELKAQVARLRQQLAKQPAAPAKIERIEVPILDQNTTNLIRTGIGEVGLLRSAVAGLDSQVEALWKSFNGLAGRIAQAPIPPTQRVPVPREYRLPRTMPSLRSSTNGEPLPKGERATLIGCAQYPDGVARETLTVLTGYKRSSRDAYIQRLRERGYLDQQGDNLIATEPGIAALGADYQPLPTGSALLEHWMTRLPEGERKVLAVLTAAYPDSVRREVIDEQTGYQRSSRDAYLQRMSAKRLVTGNRGEVRASDQLFD